VRGSAELDPQFASWDRFEASLRASFGERVTRAQAVRTWDRLKHKESIDDFIDELSRLMWLTGYEGEVVEDKIPQGLNDTMALEWAKVARKPYELGDQLALLRDMGHAIEDATRHRKKPQQGQQQGGQQQGSQPQNKDGKGKGPNPKNPKGKGGQPAGGQSKKPREWKDEAVELKGIPKEILEERRQARKCQKCGKPNHKWVDCYTKAPVTTRTIAGTKRGSDGSDSSKGSKKAKTAAAQAQPESPAAVASGRVIEIPGDAIGEDFDVWALP